MDSVAAVRKNLGAAYKDLLRTLYNRQLSEMGSKKKRSDLPEISLDTGTWKDGGIRNKPLAWLVDFRFETEGAHWVAGPDPVASNEYWKRLGGSFNAHSPLQGVLTRVIPVFKISPEGQSDDRRPHPYWEWGLVFVFPGLPVFSDSGSSGATIDFDPTTGILSSTIGTKEIKQPYVAAGLFKLVPNDDTWSEGSLALTYGEATEALADLINVEVAAPKPESA